MAHDRSSSDGLARWLAGGLVGGAIVLGLLVAAYTIGYHRGQHHPHAAAARPSGQTTTTTGPAVTTTTTTTTSRPTQSPAQLAATGKRLFTADGCSACHSLNGSAGAGPTLQGVAGRTVQLGTGQTVTADGRYLSESITDPDAQVVKGYSPGIMSAAVQSYGLAAKPADVQALVAYLQTQK